MVGINIRIRVNLGGLRLKVCFVGVHFFSSKEYRKRNASGAVYDDPRVAVGAGRFDEVGAAAEA